MLKKIKITKENKVMVTTTKEGISQDTETVTTLHVSLDDLAKVQEAMDKFLPLFFSSLKICEHQRKEWGMELSETLRPIKVTSISLGEGWLVITVKLTLTETSCLNSPCLKAENYFYDCEVEELEELITQIMRELASEKQSKLTGSSNNANK